MRINRLPYLYLVFAAYSLFLTSWHASLDARLENASREDKAGWIYIHVEGTPNQIGYQHGYLLAREIDDAIKTLKFYLSRSTRKDWSFYRQSAEKMFRPKLTDEYKNEIEGISEGLNARGMKYDTIDITALNGWIELAQYYLPALRAKRIKGADIDKSPGSCSAFIATGSYTSDGRIVMAHNNWIDYIIGERWNIIEDIVPEKGNEIFMDTFPGFIHSGDDFAENSAGILITETTIAQFRGFDTSGTPEFMRAREAEQYSNSIDDFVKIMTTGNNGGYANDWLVGDTKTNEVARLELGLKNYKTWRTKDGYYVGSNFPVDKRLIVEETTFKAGNLYTSMNDRRARWEKLMREYKGRIDAKRAEEFMGDHFDQVRGKEGPNACVLCGHTDEDSIGVRQWGWRPFTPGGAVQGKVATAEMAGKMEFVARMGHPCGESFIASKFFAAHPGYRWQSKYLHDMISHPWTLFASKSSAAK
ncbi:MAG TPA: C45 family peptidase [Candidatus Acidoferrales bacterium]|nr:C45 family peptidase [Candidatus Acidoferrales bacterium]